MPLNDWLEILPQNFQPENCVLSGTEACRLRHDILSSLQWMEDAVERLEDAETRISQLKREKEEALTLALKCNETTKEAQAIARQAIERLEEIHGIADPA
jgi:hypothetical protein